ncbi:MAG: HlyD family efflux transporter periplasmic adaptor subunit [Clostridiales bacterium]|nr:HlyD family efflux transporter periplasmic adaptor subunit [Clostridiales bacterium]
MSETEAVKPVRKKKKGRVKKAVKRIVKILLLVILAIAALFLLKAYIGKQAESNADSESLSQGVVLRGAMEETVYGTGTTSAVNQPNLLAEADGTLTELRVAIGDEVKAGDILAVITNDELDDTITDLEFSLWELDDTITGTAVGSKVTSIVAPAAGRLMAVYAEAGDDALAVFRREGALAIISTDGRMKVEFDSEQTSMNASLGETVLVQGVGIDTTGTITDLTRQGTHATVTILSDEFEMGHEVSVVTQSGEVLGKGTLEVNKPMAVSSYGGTIKSVRVTVGQEVKRKDTLFTLEDSPLTLTLENLRLQREAAAKELADAKAQRESLIILAPCDGQIATLNVSEGDEITSGTLLGSILQGEDMSLTIAVDELDVVSVEPGQKVTITVDALSGVEMEGEVYKIAPVGTNSGGVTTYDVELSFDANGTGVRSGMNATGEIQVASKEDTLYVPVEAIMTINNQTYVMVADESGQAVAASQTMPAARGANASGTRPERGTEGVPTQGDAPAEGQSGGRGTRGTPQTTETDGAAESATPTGAQTGEAESSFLSEAYRRLMAWLYEGVETGTQMTGSLVRVETGMQNDDYAEILSGVSEGDVILYTASSSSSSTNSWGGNNRGGNMGGGAPGMMGFGF